MDEPFETAPQGRRAYAEDWDREAAGRRLHPKAYWGPVMDLFNAGADPVREAILQYMQRELGVADGLNKNATPEQRKMFMLWAEKKWPRLCASIASWPKDEQGNASLAGKFRQTQREAAVEEGVRLSSGRIVTKPQPGPAAPVGPNVALYVACFCGQRTYLKAATGQYRCKCGATVTVSEFLVQMQPGGGPITFGADPEGDGLQPYAGTSVRSARPVIARAQDLRPGVVKLGAYANEDEDVGLPRGFSGLGGMRVGAAGSFRREPFSAEEGHDPGDTQDLSDVPDSREPQGDLF